MLFSQNKPLLENNTLLKGPQEAAAITGDIMNCFYLFVVLSFYIFNAGTELPKKVVLTLAATMIRGKIHVKTNLTKKKKK